MQRIIQSQTHSKTQDMQRDYYLNQKKTLEVLFTYRTVLWIRSFWLGQHCCGSVTYSYGSGSSDPYLCLTDADPGAPTAYGFFSRNNLCSAFSLFIMFKFTFFYLQSNERIPQKGLAACCKCRSTNNAALKLGKVLTVGSGLDSELISPNPYFQF